MHYRHSSYVFIRYSAHFYRAHILGNISFQCSEMQALGVERTKDLEIVSEDKIHELSGRHPPTDPQTPRLAPANSA